MLTDRASSKLSGAWPLQSSMSYVPVTCRFTEQVSIPKPKVILQSRTASPPASAVTTLFPAKSNMCSGSRGSLGDLKTILPILFSLVKPRGQRRANTPVIKIQTGLSRPCFHLPLLPHTDHKCWPHQILEVIGYPLKHLNTTWRSNTHRNTHSSGYTTHTLVSAVILTMLVGDLGCRVGGLSEKGKKIWEKGSTGKKGGL